MGYCRANVGLSFQNSPISFTVCYLQFREYVLIKTVAYLSYHFIHVDGLT